MTATELIKQVRGLYRSRKSPEYARAKEVVRILRRWGYGGTSDAFVLALGWGCELVQGADLSYVDLRTRLARIAGEDGLLLFCAIEAISENPPPSHPKLSGQARAEERSRWHDCFLKGFDKYPCDFAIVRLAMCVVARLAGDSVNGDAECRFHKDEMGVLCGIIKRRQNQFQAAGETLCDDGVA